MIKITDANTIRPEDLKTQRDSEQPDVSATVAQILRDVKQQGDAAVLAYTQKFDGVAPKNMHVGQEEIQAALAAVGEEYITMLTCAAQNIRAFHQKQVRQGFVMAEEPGIVMGQRVIPLQRVGVYVPGGTASYPSTVLMTALPAKIAGVEDIIMVTPPNKQGEVKPEILAAASVAGVTKIYKIGGAQAVAALAYGTESIPAVDKIMGPGNIFVATAKRMVFGTVDIDMIAGPSDILVVADEKASPVCVAADMLGQAEHDKLAAAVLVTTSHPLAEAVCEELEKQLATLPRKEIAEQALKNNGRIIIASTIEQAVEFANIIAPEHLELCVEDPFSLLPLVRNAGSVFLGGNTPEALGDYYAGPNHTLPTEGTARFSSPLSVDDFVKKSSYLYYSKEALQKAADNVVAFARSEGLDAHAQSVVVRTQTS